MRESKFVEQNKEKWEEFEADLKANKNDPQLLRARMVQITDDLSYSRTFYKNRSVRIYLNGLAQQIYNNIYKNKRNFFKSLSQFYSEDIPRILYHARKELLLAFLLLLLTVAIGAFSTAKDPGFASSVLSDDYVEMTKENIRKGDPFGVYKDSDSTSMFVGIALNNLKVGLILFLFGLLASYGSLAIMIYNGIMLGTFMYFFYSRDLSTEFNLTVWMHGTIEILTMVIETVAGMLLGRGLIYPGTLSRTKAFSIWGKRGAMLFMSTVPFIILAAFIESYLTRHTEMSNIMRAVFILLSLGLMLFYFAVYPLWKFRKTKDVDLGMPELSAESAIEFKPDSIYSGGSVFLKSVQLFGLTFPFLIRTALISAAAYTAIIYFLHKERMIKTIASSQMTIEDFITKLFNGSNHVFKDLFNGMGIVLNSWSLPEICVISTLWLGFLLSLGLWLFNKKIIRKNVQFLKILGYGTGVSLFLNILYLLNISLWIFYLLLLAPLAVFATERVFGLGKSYSSGRVFKYISSGSFRLLGISVSLLLMVIILVFFFMTPFYITLRQLLEMNFDLPETSFNIMVNMFVFFIMTFMNALVVLFIVMQSAFLTFTLKEISDAEGLKRNIEEIGRTRRAYGIETE